MIENIDTFYLLAELAIVVAGFAGVATVFGGQERNFEEAEILRLRALFQLSALVLVGCFLLFTLPSAGFTNEQSVVTASAVTFVMLLLLFFDVQLKATRLRKQSNTSVTLQSLIVAWSPYLLSVPLLILNFAWIRQEWPLIATYSYYILMTLWVFYRLLVHRS